jgi:hypothetical protein
MAAPKKRSKARKPAKSANSRGARATAKAKPARSEVVHSDVRREYLAWQLSRLGR